MIPIIRFDLARHLRAISTYIYFLILAGIAFLLMITAGGAFQSASVTMGGGKVFVNSPYSLAQFISLLSYFGLLIISALLDAGPSVATILVRRSRLICRILSAPASGPATGFGGRASAAPACRG